MKKNEKELLDQLAQMFNTLNAGCVIPYLDENIMYLSQTADNVIIGKPQVKNFLRQVCKSIRNFKKKNYLVVGALSHDPDTEGGEPYLLLGQYSDHGSKESKVTIKTENNLITEIEIILLAYTGAL
ncbi:MAG: hypothetical protein R3A12_13220 [Ignavibacteria bacterium]|nr:hypothetical protein [Ignavibacteriota bacterium]